VRGRLFRTPTFTLRPGLIPAGAGQTVGLFRVVLAYRAHPRGCGADCVGAADAVASLGSSPRVRGRQLVHLLGGELLGLIPAGAGQTCSAEVEASACGAHPRGCGADVPAKLVTVAVMGLSPRVRGRHLRILAARVSEGLIPAGAGQTGDSEQVDWKARAHPRGCGADSARFSALSPPWGSSPRVRGRRAAWP